MDLLSPDFGVFFWQFITIFLVLFVCRPFLKIITRSLSDRKKLIDDSISNAKEIDERLNNMKELEKNCLIEVSQKKERMLEEVKILREERINGLEVEYKNLVIEMKKRLKAEEEAFAAEWMKKSYNIAVMNVLGCTRRFLYSELSNPKDQNIFISALVDKLSLEVKKPNEQQIVC